MHINLFENQQCKIKYDRISQSKSSFSKTYQMIWITEGDGTLNIGGRQIILKSDTLIYIPISTTYTLIPQMRIDFIKVYIPKDYIDLNPTLLNTMFDVNILDIKQLIATYIYKYNKRADFNINHETRQLVEDMMPHIKSTSLKISAVHDSRVLQCIDFIEKNKKVRFSVAQIATSLHINPTYLSTLFKNEVGTTIVKYTNNLRLEAAIYEIRHTATSITQIAYNNGFADVRTLNETIKSKYNITPMQIRQRVTLGQLDELGTNAYNQIIDKYKLALVLEQIQNLELKIDTSQTIEPYQNSFNCIAIGRAHDILYANVQAQLIQSKNELKFKYCRFHNIFGDEMNIIDTDYHGKQQFNFSKPFRIIEFLLEHDVIPFIELGFFPKQICHQEQAVFTGYTVNVGGDINFELWQQLITEFFTALITVFPTDYLKMRFDFWNEVDVKPFWPNPKDDFYKLYEISYTAIKAIDSNILIGGFNYGNFIRDTKAIEEDLNYCKSRNILPDFLTIHSYPLYIEGDYAHNPDLAIESIKPTYIKDKLNQDISKLQALKEKYNFKETYISEWNTSPMQREHLNDTTYKSSKIISEILNSHSNLINGICYWTLSDEMAEFGYPLGEVHGGFGLFTRNGIAKPAYYGYLLASRLSGDLLHKTEHSIVVKTDTGYVILINNSVDYDRNYYKLNFGSETQIMDGNTIKATIKLSNIKPGLYSKTKLCIDSSFNLEANFNTLFESKTYLTKDDIKLLKELSKLSQTTKLVPLTNEYEITCRVQQTCTTLISLKRQDT